MDLFEQRKYQVHQGYDSSSIGWKLHGEFYVDLDTRFQPTIEDYGKVEEAIALKGGAVHAEIALLNAQKQYGQQIRIDTRINQLEDRREELVDISLCCPNCQRGLETGNIVDCSNCGSIIHYNTGDYYIQSLQRQIYLLSQHEQFLHKRQEKDYFSISDKNTLEEIEEVLREKRSLLELEIKAQIKDHGEKSVKKEGLVCIACGAKLENPHACDYCGSSIVYTDTSIDKMSKMTPEASQRFIQENQQMLLSAARNLAILEGQAETYGGKDFASTKLFGQILFWRHLFDKSRVLITNAMIRGKIQTIAPPRDIPYSRALTETDIKKSTALVTRCQSCGVATESLTGRGHQEPPEVINLCSCEYCGQELDYGNQETERQLLRYYLSGIQKRYEGICKSLKVIFNQAKDLAKTQGESGQSLDQSIGNYISVGKGKYNNVLILESLLYRYPRFIDQANSFFRMYEKVTNQHLEPLSDLEVLKASLD